jgi:hypothetical protein
MQGWKDVMTQMPPLPGIRVYKTYGLLIDPAVSYRDATVVSFVSDKLEMRSCKPKLIPACVRDPAPPRRLARRAEKRHYGFGRTGLAPDVGIRLRCIKENARMTMSVLYVRCRA